MREAADVALARSSGLHISPAAFAVSTAAAPASIGRLWRGGIGFM